MMGCWGDEEIGRKPLNSRREATRRKRQIRKDSHRPFPIEGKELPSWRERISLLAYKHSSMICVSDFELPIKDQCGKLDVKGVNLCTE